METIGAGTIGLRLRQRLFAHLVAENFASGMASAVLMYGSDSDSSPVRRIQERTVACRADLREYDVQHHAQAREGSATREARV